MTTTWIEMTTKNIFIISEGYLFHYLGLFIIKTPKNINLYLMNNIFPPEIINACVESHFSQFSNK